MRKRLVTLHLWFGLCIGLFWAIQGMTGALLVFHREADRLALPAPDGGPMASLDLIIGEASAAAGARIERLAIIERRGDVLSAEYRDAAGRPHALLIDAALATILDRRELEPLSPASGSISQWLYLLHQSLLFGEDRDAIVGVSGFLLLIASAVGLWIAWPRRGAWRASFAWKRWRSTDQRLYGWHRAIGLGAGVVFLVTVPCGMYLVFAGEIRPVLASLVPHSLPYRAAASATLPSSRVTPQAALAVARARFPDAAFVSMSMPSAGSPVYAVRLRQPDEPRLWAGVTSVAVDAANGAVANVYDPVSAPISNRVADLLFSIHTGEVGGLPGRLLILLAGLSLPALYVLGLVGWWRRSRRKQAVRRSPRRPNGELRRHAPELERASR